PRRPDPAPRAAPAPHRASSRAIAPAPAPVSRGDQQAVVKSTQSSSDRLSSELSPVSRASSPGFWEAAGKAPLRPEAERERQGRGAERGATLFPVASRSATASMLLAAGRSPGGLFQRPLDRHPGKL